MKILRSFCIFCFTFITCVAWRGYDVNPELYYENVEAIKRIFDTSRLQNYSTITLPTNPLTLYVKLIVQELIELDVKKEQLEVMGWMRLIWQDSRLSWSEEMFGIRELRVFPDNIWTPDVVIINSAQELPKGSHLPATVDSTGYVYWFLPARITTRCETDARFFPFDVQTCFIDLGSWTYSQELLQLTLLEYKTLLERVSQNIQWSITNIQASLVTAERFSEFHNKPMNFSKVQYSLTIERKPSFYVYCIFVPILLGASLGALTFLIPVDNGAKVSFPISMFLALFVNQLVINQFVPPSADTMPLVTILCTVLTSLFALNVAQTAIVLRVFHSGMNAHKIPVSYCLYTLLHFLENIGKRSFIYSHVYNPLHRNNFEGKSNWFEAMGDKKFNEFNVAYYISRGQQRSVDEHEDESGGGSGANYQKDATRAVGRHSNSGSYEDIRSSILEYYLREISRRLNILKEREYMDYVHDKWHTVAAGSDLLFLYLYFVSLTALVSYLAFTCLE